jgi:hypothetical protein
MFCIPVILPRDISRESTLSETYGRETPPKLKAPELDTCNFIVNEAISLPFNPTWVLLRRVFFINEGKASLSPSVSILRAAADFRKNWVSTV